MKLLVFGQTGQVARELARRLPGDMQATFLDRHAADLADPTACAASVQDAACDVVINAAAWTAVDRAEVEEEAATLVNAQAPAAMAQACAARDLPFVHLSTDYVFDGQGEAPFAPDDPVAPQNAYGRSKAAGEAAIRASGARHVILRTSWVVSAHGSNFVKTMLRLGQERDHLTVVADQIGGPTPAAAIADAVFTLARALQGGAPGGTYHFSGAPDIAWSGFARAIMDRAGLACRIDDIPTSAWPTLARRPLNSRLDCTSLTRDFTIARPDWRTGLADILQELTA